MAAEIPWVAHFTEAGQAAMNVYRKDFSDIQRTYYLRAFDPDDKRVPHAALEVRTANKVVVDTLEKTRHYALRVQYPDAELQFERTPGIELKHVLVLAQTALSEAAWSNFALVGSDDKKAVFERSLRVLPTEIVRLKPGRFAELEYQQALVGNTQEAIKYAHRGLKEAGIARAPELPA